MKLALAILWILSLAAAFGLARMTGSTAAPGSERSLETLRAGLLERDALVRAYLLSSYLRELGPDELPASLELVEEHFLGMQPEDVSLLMHAWSRFDPAGALEWARAWPTGWRDKLMQAAVLAWGFRDGPGALRALEALEDEELERTLRPSLLAGWLQSDDTEAASLYVANEGDPRVRRRLTFTLASERAKAGVEAVIAWAEAVPDDAPNDFKQGSFYHASSVVARSDPQRVAAWFEAHRADWYSEGSLDTIARKWGQHRDPAALFEWLRTLPPGEGERAGEVDAAMVAGLRPWRRRDPTAAEAWLRAALPDPKLDAAVEQIAWSHAVESPESALAWALRIEDDRRREGNVVRLARSWRARDPQAAGAWLAASGLPEPLRSSIVEDTQRQARRRAGVPAVPVNP